ncbi:MAG: hypothetical protein ABIC91_06360 [Nanoarchaeota archaeon]|nr:hypothetical protein [Nanoarchaeota archaeon]MBU1030397.1 hypothetical protein [Nanoarchaeota archaeon]MBU1850019.1 hypothetical protein [Nanoarchaeota archaeon]
MKMNQEKIRKEAKKIMDEFIKELDKITLSKDFGIKRKQETRKKFTDDSDEKFRERMLENAPNVKDDFIVAEKKKW